MVFASTAGLTTVTVPLISPPGPRSSHVFRRELPQLHEPGMFALAITLEMSTTDITAEPLLAISPMFSGRSDTMPLMGLRISAYELAPERFEMCLRRIHLRLGACHLFIRPTVCSESRCRFAVSY